MSFLSINWELGLELGFQASFIIPFSVRLKGFVAFALHALNFP